MAIEVRRKKIGRSNDFDFEKNFKMGKFLVTAGLIQQSKKENICCQTQADAIASEDVKWRHVKEILTTETWCIADEKSLQYVQLSVPNMYIDVP